jgi:type IV pilus assembly PilO-like protein
MNKLPTPAKIGLVVAGVLLALIVGYFVLISPKRSDVSSLKQQIAAARNDIAEARGVKTPSQPQIKVADLFRLSRAMPDTADIPGVLLQLSNVAAETGVSFQSITPHDPVAYGAYEQISIDLTFEGRFYDLSDFLYRLRNLVSVHNGVLDATGRMFSVTSITFNQGTLSFPQVRAGLTVSAYVYGNGTPPPVPTGVASGTGPTQTTTTPAAVAADSQPIPAAPAGATASGA